MAKLVSGTNDLKTYCKKNNREDLLEEWDSEKNDTLKPSDVSYSSNKNVWWKCNKGHKWQSKISNRVYRNDGCPYCSGKRVIEGETDLQTLYPDIAKEWHPTKNGDLKPSDVTAKSGISVWWQCKEGHEWKAFISNRTKQNTGCPYCSGRLAIKGETDLQTLYPDIAKEWHPTKNGDLKPSDVTAKSGISVWWQCKEGHEWKAPVVQRTNGNTGCPYCSGRLAIEGETDLQTLYPEIAKEWHPTKNGDIRPSDVTTHSGVKYWWQCKEGHEWKATVADRTNGDTGCPYCANKKVLPGFNDLQTLYPEIAKEWNYEKNGDLKPTDVVPGSIKSVWWKCAEGHEWKTRIVSRTKIGIGCPYCSNKRIIPGFNDLQTLYPDVAKEWNYDKNGELKPTAVAFGSNKKVWWKCSKGHEWQAVIASRTGKEQTGCPYCSNKKVLPGFNDLATTHPEIAKEWHPTKNGELNPTDVTYGSTRQVWWKCEKGHEWRVQVNSRTQGTGCPYCSGYGTSLPEQGIAFYLEQICSIEQRKRICKQEIDIYLPEYKIGVEYDGRFYHQLSSAAKEARKDQILSKNGIRVIRVKESDYNLVDGELIYYKFDNMKSNYEWAIYQLLSLLSDITGNKHFTSIRVDAKKDSLRIRERFNLFNKDKSVLALFPDIAKEWNYEKNGELKPDMFPLGSHTKVWWKCDKGHEWQASIKSRTLLKSGCPYCAGQRAVKGENDLQTLLPNIAAEWHPTKNGELEPSSVMLNSNKKVWWKCDKGHEWQAKVYDRTRNNTGCPYCSGVGNKKVRNIDTGEIYNSIKEAARSCGLKSGATISNCCQGKQSTAGGFHWEYYEENSKL